MLGLWTVWILTHLGFLALGGVCIFGAIEAQKDHTLSDEDSQAGGLAVLFVIGIILVIFGIGSFFFPLTGL